MTWTALKTMYPTNPNQYSTFQRFLSWCRNQFSSSPADVHHMPIGHITFWYDASNQTINYVTGAVFLRLLLLTIWQTDNSKLWLKVGADYSVVISQKKGIKSFFIMYVFKWSTEVSGWPQSDVIQSRCCQYGPLSHFTPWLVLRL
jgi:hypothetical protein